MIDELGLKGLSVGDARVSDRHANFFVNAGKASAKDMLALIADVRERVQRRTASSWRTRWWFGTRKGHASECGGGCRSYRPELIADDEPRYLRRQKPVEIRRKKFSGRGWPFYRRLLVLSFVGVAGVTAASYGMRFLLYSPTMLLLKPDQIELTGNHIGQREAVVQTVCSRSQPQRPPHCIGHSPQPDRANSLGRIRQRATDSAEPDSRRADRTDARRLRRATGTNWR